LSEKQQNNVFDVLIAGGGAAGIGLAASLKCRDKTLKIAIIEPSDHHFYQPSWTLVVAEHLISKKAGGIPKM